MLDSLLNSHLARGGGWRAGSRTAARRLSAQAVSASKGKGAVNGAVSNTKLQRRSDQATWEFGTLTLDAREPSSGKILLVTSDGKVQAELQRPFLERAAGSHKLGTGQTFSVQYDVDYFGSISPRGYYVSGRNDEYCLRLHRGPMGSTVLDRVADVDTVESLVGRGVIVRLCRNDARPMVPGEERREIAEIVKGSLALRYSPASIPTINIPGVKPFIRTIAPMSDGTIWVERYGESVRDPSKAAKVATNIFPQRSRLFIELLVYDVWHPQDGFLAPILFT